MHAKTKEIRRAIPHAEAGEISDWLGVKSPHKSGNLTSMLAYAVYEDALNLSFRELW